MAKRGPKYPDTQTVGRSKIIPFRPHEHPMDRHERRKQANLNHEAAIRAILAPHNIKLQINNHGHHWIFTRDGQKVEWWPSSAKMVMNQAWDKGIHVHDYEQALGQVGRFFGIQPDTTK